MQKLISLFLFFVLYFSFSLVQAQEDKYRAIQGFGYLHTQVTMLIVHWKTHPLNHKAVDKHEADLQNHIINELEHDEEWVEFMMVEGSLSHFSDHIDQDVQKTINENLQFYHKVLTHLRQPDDINKHLSEWKESLKKAEEKLYKIIYPALCK
jgi:hypothetical protein